MPFIYHRRIRFEDTDAAGVVFFTNPLKICHEAYEESLAESGVPLTEFFSGRLGGFPIVEAGIQFFRPLRCGEECVVQGSPRGLSEDTFLIDYELFQASDPSRAACTAQTRHVCIDPVLRKRQPLPPFMRAWLAHWPPDSPPIASIQPD